MQISPDPKHSTPAKSIVSPTYERPGRHAGGGPLTCDGGTKPYPCTATHRITPRQRRVGGGGHGPGRWGSGAGARAEGKCRGRPHLNVHGLGLRHGLGDHGRLVAGALAHLPQHGEALEVAGHDILRQPAGSALRRVTPPPAPRNGRPRATARCEQDRRAGRAPGLDLDHGDGEAHGLGVAGDGDAGRVDALVDLDHGARVLLQGP